MTKTTQRDVDMARRDYRDIVAMQRRAPESERWTFGARIKAAKAKAYMLAEALKLGM